MTFWQEIDAQLDRIEAEKPETFDGVRKILLDPNAHEIAADRDLNGARVFTADEAFFAGSGGDRTLRSALYGAGWRPTWFRASYDWGMAHPATGETLTYCEGDVLRGDAR